METNIPDWKGVRVWSGVWIGVWRGHCAIVVVVQPKELLDYKSKLVFALEIILIPWGSTPSFSRPEIMTRDMA
jgi:hypothetical protein